MNDTINCAFESLAGVFVFLSVWRVWKDKQVRGVSWIMILFMLTWSGWNLYYYPSLGQWNSFYGGLIIAFANFCWITSMWRFRDPKPKPLVLEEWRASVVTACDKMIADRHEMLVGMGNDNSGRRAIHDVAPISVLRESFKVYK